MPLYKIEEAADLLKVTPETVTKWIKQGRLRASKLSGEKTLRISDGDIMAFYDANATREKGESKSALDH